MKKLFSLALAAVLLLGLFACGKAGPRLRDVAPGRVEVIRSPVHGALLSARPYGSGYLLHTGGGDGEALVTRIDAEGQPLWEAEISSSMKSLWPLGESMTIVRRPGNGIKRYAALGQNGETLWEAALETGYEYYEYAAFYPDHAGGAYVLGYMTGARLVPGENYMDLYVNHMEDATRPKVAKPKMDAVYSRYDAKGKLLCRKTFFAEDVAGGCPYVFAGRSGQVLTG